MGRGVQFKLRQATQYSMETPYSWSTGSLGTALVVKERTLKYM